MRALFKQEDPKVLIVRDADWNEASLLIKYLESIKNGASIEAKAAFNGNQEVNGIVFTIAEKEVEPVVDSYIKISATVTNSSLDLPVFRIQLAPESSNYSSFKVDTTKWNDLKLVLNALGVGDLSITPQGDIVGANKSGIVIEGTVVIPRGLLRFVDMATSTTNTYNDDLTITLEKDPHEPEVDYDDVKY